MKIIRDIRIYKGVGHTEIKNKIMNLSAHRAAMKLRENNFLSENTIIYIFAFLLIYRQARLY